MAGVLTMYEHIVIGDDGVPFIDNTTMKVVELVLAQKAHGWSPEEIHFQHPYLSLGQIHSALAYYWDHQDEIEQDIERRLDKVEEIRKRTPRSSLVERLKAEGRI
jgi:uncharacterized protein (DUF433 family)